MFSAASVRNKNNFLYRFYCFSFFFLFKYHTNLLNYDLLGIYIYIEIPYRIFIYRFRFRSYYALY